MRLRYWTALAAGGLLLSYAGASLLPSAPSPEAGAIRAPAPRDIALLGSSFGPPPAQPPAVAPPEQEIWSGALQPGQTLDEVLAKAGLDSALRVEASRLIGTLYDLRRLKPGYWVAVSAAGAEAPPKVALETEDGQRIEVQLGPEPKVRSLSPELETVTRAAETEIRSSIYAALDRVQAPTRFATDLELILADLLDLRREIGGGERLRVVWREDRLRDRVVGDPVIDFAQFELGGETYEIIWPAAGRAGTYIYKDGELAHRFRQPVPGARLSSAYGPRIHPVHGGKRLHKGVDFAAPEGTPVHAMNEGVVTFAGAKPGYGYLIEIRHAQDVVTRYGHLGPDGIAVTPGQHVAPGALIGAVGNTGTSTAPHLHYEVIVAGEHVSPLDHAWPLRPGSPGQDAARLQKRLAQARDQLTQTLDQPPQDG